MKWQIIRTTYPMAAIAYYFQIDYLKVLMAADYLYSQCERSDISHWDAVDYQVQAVIADARLQHQWFASNMANWLNGYELRVPVL